MMIQKIANINLKKCLTSLNNLNRMSIELSVSWKKISREHLLSAKNENEFHDAFLWCGKAGHATRGTKEANWAEYSKHLFDNKKQILNGTFILSKENKNLAKNGHDTLPISWTTKILHILNPSDYPLICDSKIRKALSINTLKQFEKECLELKKILNIKSLKEIYLLDSYLWETNK